MRALLLLSLLVVEQPGKARKPNIVFFYVDDLGARDLSCYGSKFFETPHIDRMAHQGMKFTQAYMAHPRCVPSRLALFTGKFPARYGVPGGRRSGQYGHIPLSETTVADALQSAGYKTFFLGKWHLGKRGSYPENHGFDINIAGHHAGSPSSYFYPYKNKSGNSSKQIKNHDVPNLEGGNPGEYLTDRLTDEAVKLIEKYKDSLFFLFLSHYAVHTPFEGKERTCQKISNKSHAPGKDHRYDQRKKALSQRESRTMRRMARWWRASTTAFTRFS